MTFGNLARRLKEHDLIRPPPDAPEVGQVRYRYGEAFKILAVDWMNDTLTVQHEDDPPQFCGYYTFCNMAREAP